MFSQKILNSILKWKTMLCQWVNLKKNEDRLLLFIKTSWEIQVLYITNILPVAKTDLMIHLGLMKHLLKDLPLLWAQHTLPKWNKN